MAANIDPIFGIIPAAAIPVTLSTANTARDGSGTLFTLFTPSSFGGRFSAVTFTSSSSAVGASVLKVCRVWETDASGVNAKLIGEVLLPLITSSNTVIGATATFTCTTPRPLKSGQLIRGSISLCATSADNVDAVCDAVDF